MAFLGNSWSEAPRKIGVDEFHMRKQVGFKITHMGAWVRVGHNFGIKARDIPRTIERNGLGHGRGSHFLLLLIPLHPDRHGRGRTWPLRVGLQTGRHPLAKIRKKLILQQGLTHNTTSVSGNTA